MFKREKLIIQHEPVKSSAAWPSLSEQHGFVDVWDCLNMNWCLTVFQLFRACIPLSTNDFKKIRNGLSREFPTGFSTRSLAMKAGMDTDTHTQTREPQHGLGPAPLCPAAGHRGRSSPRPAPCGFPARGVSPRSPPWGHRGAAGGGEDTWVSRRVDRWMDRLQVRPSTRSPGREG